MAIRLEDPHVLMLDFFHRPVSGTNRPLSIDGVPVAVRFRRNPRARRLILRMSEDGVTVTLPPGTSERSGLEFALRHAGWIRRQLAGQSRARPFTPGNRVPVRGTPHLIEQAIRRRGGVEVVGGAEPRLVVAADEPHIARRVGDWLKAEARRDLAAASGVYAEAMDTRYRRLSLRDQASRWGSCSSAGHLSYSWRLILAPAFVLDYVAAHEVAHLIELNHSPRFWSLVRNHAPHAEEARRWLKAHGPGLHSYGG